MNAIQKHIKAIKAGSVTKTNIIGIRKALNADNRMRRNYSVSSTAPVIEPGQIEELVAAIHEKTPVVQGELHDSGVKVLTSPRYRKQLQSVSDRIESGIQAFRLVDYWEEKGNVYPVYQVQTPRGFFRFFNIPWQSGGNGPELL